MPDFKDFPKILLSFQFTNIPICMIDVAFKLKQTKTMRRLVTCFPFSKFYHPCNFTIPPQVIQTSTCSLENYVSLYRAHGHHYAKLDPLNLHNKNYEEFVRPTDLQIKFQDPLHAYKFNSPVTEASQSIEQLESKLKDIYLGTIGVEFQHVSSLKERAWLYDNYERIKLEPVENDFRVRLARGLVEAEVFDHFLHKKWVTYKRYSGEGAESTVVALEHLFELSSQVGYEHVVFGMPHRGRMNTLVNVLGYGSRNLFRKIAGKTDTPTELVNIIDDVTSHVAQSTVKDVKGKKLKVTLAHNPSHLQAQNPVSMGKTHSKQQLHGADKVLNVQVHGDAAICAQGIVYQTLCIAKTPNFSVGGTIHLITNNQIGYTTRPIDSRPSKYATDLFKAYDAPILHVNAQKIEDVYRAVKFAVQYQRQFKKDVMIDLICYRKYGHNEVDEPEFTQPKMYKKIRKEHEPSPIKYTKLLAGEGVISADFYEKVRKDKFQEFENEFNQSQKIAKVSLQDYTSPKSISSARAFSQLWKDMKPSQYGVQYPTAFSVDSLKEFAQASLFVPPGFQLQKTSRDCWSQVTYFISQIVLRHTSCVSKFEEMGPGTSFQPILPYRNIQKIDQSEVIILTSGKFLYDIEQILVQKKVEKTVLLAIEELYPFPESRLKQLLQKAPKTAQYYWAQEESFNSGAFLFVQPASTASFRASDWLKRFDTSADEHYQQRQWEVFSCTNAKAKNYHSGSIGLQFDKCITIIKLIHQAMGQPPIEPEKVIPPALRYEVDPRMVEFTIQLPSSFPSTYQRFISQVEGFYNKLPEGDLCSYLAHCINERFRRYNLINEEAFHREKSIYDFFTVDYSKFQGEEEWRELNNKESFLKLCRKMNQDYSIELVLADLYGKSEDIDEKLMRLGNDACTLRKKIHKEDSNQGSFEPLMLKRLFYGYYGNVLRGLGSGEDRDAIVRFHQELGKLLCLIVWGDYFGAEELFQLFYCMVYLDKVGLRPQNQLIFLRQKYYSFCLEKKYSMDVDRERLSALVSTARLYLDELYLTTLQQAQDPQISYGGDSLVPVKVFPVQRAKQRVIR